MISSSFIVGRPDTCRLCLFLHCSYLILSYHKMNEVRPGPTRLLLPLPQSVVNKCLTCCLWPPNLARVRNFTEVPQTALERVPSRNSFGGQTLISKNVAQRSPCRTSTVEPHVMISPWSCNPPQKHDKHRTRFRPCQRLQRGFNHGFACRLNNFCD